VDVGFRLLDVLERRQELHLLAGAKMDDGRAWSVAVSKLALVDGIEMEARDDLRRDEEHRRSVVHGGREFRGDGDLAVLLAKAPQTAAELALKVAEVGNLRSGELGDREHP